MKTFSFAAQLLLCFFSLYLTTQEQQNSTGGVQEAWVRHYGANLVPGNDYAVTTAVDNAGNVYVTGYSPNVPFGYDYVTIKYDPTGLKIWVAKYNGSGNGDDIPSALAVDANGNVYVTGSCYVSSTDEDYVTVKYNAAGVKQWVARYNGSDNLVDQARALGVDANGNVYVTGGSAVKDPNSGFNKTDYVTIKYDANGKEQWVRRYNGPDDSFDAATALALDAIGNVYVTGNSSKLFLGNTFSDYATIKYASNGEQEWVARHENTPNSDDRAVAIAIDAAGNVYVTGTARTLYGDYATVKYNSHGVELWRARFNEVADEEAVALAVDQRGNVYVTGTSGPGVNDFATVKYDSAGVQQWAVRYTESTGSNEKASDLLVDLAGNVLVTGLSGPSACTTIKYSSAGVEQWIARSAEQAAGILGPAPTLAMDNLGNVYVAGTTATGVGLENPDYLAIKYNATGATQWVARYDESRSSSDIATALFVDAAGNAYVTGNSLDSSKTFEGATIKYNSAGERQWLIRHEAAEAAALVADVAGNVYVAGHSSGGIDSHDFITLKCRADGVLLWQARYDAPAHDLDQASAIVVDAKGNVYVTGKSRGQSPNTGYDYATIKYDAAGVQLWAARYAAQEGTYHELPPHLVVDAADNVYVAGNTATIKYNSGGKERWVVRDQPGDAIKVDAGGNVCLVGLNSVRDRYITTRLDSAGNKKWEAQHDAVFDFNLAPSLTVDHSGNVYVAGQSPFALTGRDYIIIKYDASGTEQWVGRYNGPSNNDEAIAAIALDNSGNIYVTGLSSENLENRADYVTIKYNPAGVEQWLARYRGPAGAYDQPVALGVDAADNVYVSGWSLGINGGGWRTYTTIKYEQTPTAVEERESEMPAQYHLAQNLPNPFNPSTVIRFDLPQAERVHLAIYNVRGELVRTLADGNLPAGAHAFTFEAKGLATGVYFYRVSTKKFTATKKMLLAK